ncbi:hypothetical protein HDU97_009152 [Phlyctochytrium planicorne]|nr:hypothetical protein HDU97_009152 [Phlyctochytrium planicorne]
MHISSASALFVVALASASTAFNIPANYNPSFASSSETSVRASGEIPKPDSYSPPATGENLVRVQGKAYNYRDCSLMRSEGVKGCEPVPAYRPDGGKVRYQCLDKNTKIGDECVRAFDGGATVYHYFLHFEY